MNVTFPITSKQLQLLNPYCTKTYEECINQETSKLLKKVIDAASNSSICVDFSIKNPKYDQFGIKGVDRKTFDESQYLKYVKDIVKELKRNLLGCRVVIHHEKDNELVEIRVDWSQDCRCGRDVL